MIDFTTINKTFFLPAKKLIEFIKTNTRKSIPLTFFEKNGYLIKDKYNPRVDYIEILEKLYFSGGNDESTN